MKSLISSVMLLVLGITLFILDDISAISIDYRITMLTIYAGIVVGIYHLYMFKDE